jgi:hypothetical protein
MQILPGSSSEGALINASARFCNREILEAPTGDAIEPIIGILPSDPSIPFAPMPSRTGRPDPTKSLPRRTNVEQR